MRLVISHSEVQVVIFSFLSPSLSSHTGSAARATMGPSDMVSRFITEKLNPNRTARYGKSRTKANVLLNSSVSGDDSDRYAYDRGRKKKRVNIQVTYHQS